MTELAERIVAALEREIPAAYGSDRRGHMPLFLLHAVVDAPDGREFRAALIELEAAGRLVLTAANKWSTDDSRQLVAHLVDGPPPGGPGGSAPPNQTPGG